MKKSVLIVSLLGILILFSINVVSATVINPQNCTHLKSLVEASGCDTGDFELNVSLDCTGETFSPICTGVDDYGGTFIEHHHH